MLQDHFLVLSFYNSSNNKYVTLLISYEKERFTCKPSRALLALEGRHLGALIKTRKSKKLKDKLMITINGDTYDGRKITAVKTYNNRVEIDSFFDEKIVHSLKNSSKFILDIGEVNITPNFYGGALNSSNISLIEIQKSSRKK